MLPLIAKHERLDSHSISAVAEAFPLYLSHLADPMAGDVVLGPTGDTPTEIHVHSRSPIARRPTRIIVPVSSFYRPVRWDDNRKVR